MLYSKVFGKTIKETPKDANLVSHKLLYRAGYIRESTAGRFYLLPLGLRVQQKIQGIIKEEMDKSGAQEIITPILHPKSLWQETNRTAAVGFELMTIKDRSEMEFVLGGTAEEMIVDLIRKFQLSYKDLPFNIYQFSTKFRDELRARGGLLRLREFLMKDAYSFHATEEDFKREYQVMKDTYTEIFKRLGLVTQIVEADNGYIGGEYSHEFVVESSSGESRYFTDEEGYAAHEDIAKEGFIGPNGQKLIAKKGIEVGNIFQLGFYYSSKMKGAEFIDAEGKKKLYYMGCYGIGLARTLAAIVEIYNDDKGIIWPDSIAPFAVHIVGLDMDDQKIKDEAEKVYKLLQAEGIEILLDDRVGVSAGEKFADADLIGIPVRVVISKKTTEKLEVKERREKETRFLSFEELIEMLRH